MPNLRRQDNLKQGLGKLLSSPRATHAGQCHLANGKLAVWEAVTVCGEKAHEEGKDTYRQVRDTWVRGRDVWAGGWRYYFLRSPPPPSWASSVRWVKVCWPQTIQGFKGQPQSQHLELWLATVGGWEPVQIGQNCSDMVHTNCSSQHPGCSICHQLTFWNIELVFSFPSFKRKNYRTGIEIRSLIR